MEGMPNFRFKLPSRNWSIFLTIVGSWTAAYTYDRREKKRILQKWQDRVSHLSKQPLAATVMPRSIRVILGAPPGDGLLTAREHYHEYVKPILIAGGLDWEAIEGRKEGDVRAMIAEKIRETRLRAGEVGELPERDESEETKDMVREIRQRNGVEFEGGRAVVHGDIVLGRNIWKEYIRGLHEGWLGPLTAPVTPPEAAPAASAADATTENIASEANTPLGASQSDLPSSQINADQGIIESLTDIVEPENASPLASEFSSAASALQTKIDKSTEEKKKLEEEEANKKKKEKAKRKQPPPFISTTEYADAPLPPSISRALGPSVAIPLPHILGFLNTPIRMYRFLRQRDLADEIGKQVVCAVLAAHEPYQQVSTSNADEQSEVMQWEQEGLLKKEEAEWHSSVRKKADANRQENKESLWIDDMVLDNRIAGKMRKFILPDSTQEPGTSEDMS